MRVIWIFVGFFVALYVFWFLVNLVLIDLFSLPVWPVVALDSVIAMFMGMCFGRWLAQRHTKQYEEWRERWR